jgi:hypothetical protein
VKHALLVVVAACGTPHPRTPSTRAKGVIEGIVIDAKTGRPLGGVDVEAYPGDEEPTRTETNEYGRYRLELAARKFDVVASYGLARAEKRLAIADGEVMHHDFRIDHDQLVVALRDFPPFNCPSSKPDTIIEGHTTPQHEVDEIARAVLERSINAPDTIPDHHRGTPDYVSTDVYSGRRRLTGAALPDGRGFVARSDEQLQQEANRTRQNVFYIRFTRIDSNGSCALVDVGAGVAKPEAADAFSSVCTCSRRDAYEKTNGRWVLVRSDLASCGG